MFTYSHANTPLGQSERAYYLSYFITPYIVLAIVTNDRQRKQIKIYIYVSQLFIRRMPKMRAIPQLVSAPLNQAIVNGGDWL